VRPVSFFAAFALLLAACGTAPAAKEPAPLLPEPSGRVVDEADLLTPAQESQLSDASAALEREVGPQFAIVTVRSLQNYSINDYSIHLARSWGLGSPQRNDGILLLVAPAERRVRIEVGRGLEQRVTDPYAARVIRNQMAPRFRENDLSGGIIAGSEALIERLRSRQSDAEIARLDGVVT
jgi:uncharacterized protein